jgi:Flp pilus assembly protein TadD
MAEGPLQEIIAARIAAAETHECHERWTEAVNAWRELAAEQADYRFLLRAALAAKNGGLNPDAEHLFREVIQVAPEQAPAYIGLGIVLEKQGRLEEARQVLERGLSLDEQQFALTILGIVQRRQSDLLAAETTLLRSIELDPTDDEAYFALGLTVAKEQPLMAVEYFRKALELDPHLPNAQRELGAVLWRLGRNDDAETALRKALVENAADSWAHDYLGHLLAIHDHWKDAKKEYLAATDLEPKVGMFWSDLADACAMLGEQAEADRYYLKALSLAIDDADVNARYGSFLKRTGRLERARVYLQRAVELDPGQHRARESLNELKEVE